MISGKFKILTYITLVFIFLVIIAGSVVRTTGSGMGCPDWPKCFDCWIPPTSVDQLPEDYKENYSEYRQKKLQKFAKFLESTGFNEAATKLMTDPDVLKEEDFNAARTWTEYGNRLVGFIAGNLVLIQLIWVLAAYRSKRMLLFLSIMNLLIMGIEAWFGSIVVASNLVPWTITLHMLLALVIVGIQIKIIRIARGKTYQLPYSRAFKILFYSSLVAVFIQILLGAQVRQEVDFLVKDAVDRGAWIGEMDTDFYFHRSFSWFILIITAALWWMNKKLQTGTSLFFWMLVIVLFEFFTGILFSYAGMPAMLQPLHLLAATLLLSLHFFGLDLIKKSRIAL